MAKAFKCDLCEEMFVGEPLKEVSVPVVTGAQMVASLCVVGRPLDLCLNCAAKLGEALHKGFVIAFAEGKLSFEIEAFLRKLQKATGASDAHL